MSEVEKPLMPNAPALCECGCGGAAPIATRNNSKRGTVKGYPQRFIRGHGWRGKKQTAESNIKRSIKLKGRRRSEEERRKTSAALKGRPHTTQHRANHVRALTGREPVYSPYIPDLIVKFDPSKKRWYCCDPKNKKRSITHARAVYEYFIGLVPEGFHVHHKTGDASRLENDAPEMLMLLPKRWNLVLIPALAEGFGIPESQVTEAYLRVFAIGKSRQELFRDLCSEILKCF